MKRILQNKQYQFLACIITAIILIILISSFKSTTKVVKVHTCVSKDIKVIEKQIADWSAYGYEVTSIVSQGIAESVTYDGRYCYGSINYHTTKSDILLVMSKRE